MKGLYTSLDERERSAIAVDVVFRRNARFIAERVIALLEPELLAGEVMPDVELLQLLVRRVLARRLKRLSEAGESLIEKRQQAAELKQTSAAETRDTRALVVDLRAAFKGFFGTRRAANFLGLRGATSRDPVEIQRQAKRAVARLLDPDRELPAARLATGLDRQSLARPIKKHADAMADAETGLVSARKRVDMALFMKDQALADYNDLFVKITTLFEGLYRLVDMEVLARKVRPSGHRKGRTFADVQRRRKKPRKTAAKTASPVAKVEAALVAPAARRKEAVAPAARIGDVVPEVRERTAPPLELVPTEREVLELEVQPGRRRSPGRRARLPRFEPLRRVLRVLRRSG